MKDSFPKIGFIGIGALGSALAEQLLHVTGALHVWNRTQDKCDALARKGATVAPDISSLVQSCDWIFSCLADNTALEAVSAAICATNAPNKTHISMTTATPDAIEKVAAHTEQTNIRFLNCPVIGRPDTVRAGKAGFLLAGAKDTAEAITPILSQIGLAPTYVGSRPADAASYKLAINYFTATTIAGMSEAFASIEAQNLSTEAFFNILMGGAAASPLINMFGNIILSPDKSEPLFQMKLAQKDMQYFSAASGENPQFHILEGILKHLNQSVGQGKGEEDWSGFARYLISKDA